MRLIGAASLVFLLALGFASSSLAPTVQAEHNGQAIFRFDTFGDEQLWTNVLRMHEVIPTIDPQTALAVGLKVDVDALPPAVIDGLRAGTIKLDDPAVTVALLSLNAVVGVKGTVTDGKLSVDLIKRVGAAKISAVEVIPVG